MAVEEQTLAGLQSSPISEQAVQQGDLRVWLYAQAQLPTRHGGFQIVVFRNNQDSLEHVALVCGEVANKAEPIAVRMHSECLTGDVLGSLRCDCRAQLDMALAQLAAATTGVLLYLRQEGRGIGLGNKIKAYALQETGIDTIDANVRLGYPADQREWRVAAMMLQILQVTKIRLMTNNPDKIAGLQAGGIEVVQRDPLITPANGYNDSYLATKAQRCGHLL